MKTILKLFLAAITLVRPVTLKADISVSDIVGIGKTLYDGIIGTTTVTPGLAIYSWKEAGWGNYQNISYNMSKTVTARQKSRWND